MQAAATSRVEALRVEPHVDCIRSRLAGMKLQPALHESEVVRATALRAGTVTRGQRGRLVEEEQLRVPTGLHQG